MYRKIVILVASALATIYLLVFLMRVAPPSHNKAVVLVRSIQVLKVAQTEKYQSDLRFAESNAEATQLVGSQIKLGRIDDAGQVVEMNVGEGGVIELLLSERDREGRRLRAIYMPVMSEPVAGGPFQWQCLSANWEGVSGIGSDCRFDRMAWEQERAHVARLRSTNEKMEQDAERLRARRESEQAHADFERQRAQLARESERAREEEERQLARLERETERARIEYERKRQVP